MEEFHDIAGYEVVATLGHGARSTIYSVRDRQNELFTLKRVIKASPSDQRYLDQATMEHQIAQRFDHPVLRKSFKLIRQRQFFRVSEILVLLEYIDGLTLEHYKPRHLGDWVSIARKVAEGLAAMHQQGYVHADIKPNNIMASKDGTVKIIDYGQSCPSGTVKRRIQGTPDYMAPEQAYRKRIIPQTDVFNLGATLYWLLTQRHIPTHIPKNKSTKHLATRNDENKECPPPREINEQVPPALSTLVMDCVAKRSSERPDTMEYVISRLEIAEAQLNRQRETRTSRKGSSQSNDAPQQRTAG